jgi:lysophospholipase L1-like esterase
LVFTKMNPSLFSEMVKKLDVKLMILQFGGNIVPNIRKDYSYYEKWFYAQLNFIRQNAPDVQIIVIGVSDMSIKQGDSYVTYPNLVLVRDALKKATFRANAIYWDMYEAMGGENSMPSWVFAKPPLAGSDFVHFNQKGAQIIANMFYNALMDEYEQYKKAESEKAQNNLEDKNK